MKEAAGEANMTVITIVLIAIVLAIGTIIITTVMNNVQNQAILFLIEDHQRLILLNSN